jgi:hypothetical protein
VGIRSAGVFSIFDAFFGSSLCSEVDGKHTPIDVVLSAEEGRAYVVECDPERNPWVRIVSREEWLTGQASAE